MFRFLLIVTLSLIFLAACEDQGTPAGSGSGSGDNTPATGTADGSGPGDNTPATGTADGSGAVPDVPAAPLTGNAGTEMVFPEISAPIPADKSAWDIAGNTKLAKVEIQDFSDLHNVVKLSDNIISGSEPHGEAALKRIADMGVKTILSVDGKAPDAETAKKLGMRYVHVPIQYQGMTDAERLKIAKVFLELEGPFFVHCFHGNHRGPAAAAWGRVVLDGAERSQAVAEMRQWCGTSEKYRGLFQAVGKSAAPTAADLSGLAFDFPAKHEFSGFRQAMVEISRAFDHLKALKKRNWKVDPDHPDLVAANEARRLVQAFTAAGKLPEVEKRPEDFRKWNEKSLEWSEKLVKRLDRVAAGEKGARDGATEAFKAVAERCDRCHGDYRNKRAK
jgi:protein tyrosine phosphatase (PTP) superfamily phosphohydrolase (DUF442 family)